MDLVGYKTINASYLLLILGKISQPPDRNAGYRIVRGIAGSDFTPFLVTGDQVYYLIILQYRRIDLNKFL